jgi:hypothetical protein
MGMIKTLWYVRKVRIYENLVVKMTKLREKIKAKQAVYQEKAVKYRAKAEAGTKV